MKICTYILIVIIFFCIAQIEQLFAQDLSELGSKRIKYYSAEDYNGHSQNWTVFQDNNGMLYFGNNDGVLQYDGVLWSRLTGSNVRCFAQGDNNKIYAGGDDDFGYLQKDAKGKNTWVSLSKKLPEEYKNYVSVLSIFKSGNKIVFFAFRGIFIYQNDVLLKVIRPETDFRFAFKLNNNIYLRQTDIGLMEFRNNSIYMLSNGKYFADKPIYMLEPFDKNHAIIATKQNGLYLVKINNLKNYKLPLDSVFTSFKTDADNFFKSNNISSGTLLKDGSYAIGSALSGLVIIDNKGHLKRIFNKQTGFPISNINCVFNDRENNVWLALNNGIIYIEMNSPLNFFGEESGYQEIPTCVMNFKGNFYLGTLTGLYLLTYNKSISQQSASYYNFKLLTKDYNSFMVLDTVDNKLFAATRYGLFEIDGEKVIPVKKMEFSYTFLHSKKNPDILYSNNSNGLVVFNKINNKWIYSGRIKGIDHEVRYIYEENDGTLWINGNNNDILKLSFNNKDFYRPTFTTYDSSKGIPNEITPVILRNINYLSVLSPGKGYYRYYSGKSPVGKKDHFYNDTFFPDIMPVTNDSIIYYLSTSVNDSVVYALTLKQGLIKITLRKGNPIIDVITSGMGQSIATFFLYPDIENNLLWFSNFKGLYSVNLNKQKTENIKFITNINFITIGKDSIVFASNDTNLIANIPFIKNSISINFAALFYQGSENNLYKYYLEGLDEKWSNWTKEKYVTYNFLPEGTYNFRVIGKNIYGFESKQAVYKFTILPPWYRTWWAYSIYGIFVILIIIVITIIYGKQLKSRNIKLEEMVQSRTAQIKKQSTEIELKNTQLSEINKQLEKLSIVAREIENSVMIMDSVGRFEWINDAFIRLYGYTLQELINKYGDNLVGYSQYPYIQQVITDCVKNKISYSYETTITNKNAQQLWTNTTLTPIIDKNGNVIKIIAIDSDITKLKLIEKKLIEQNSEIQTQKQLLEKANSELEKLSIAASETDNEVIIMDNNTNFLWINQSLKKKYEGEFDDISSKNLFNSSYNPNIKKHIAKCIHEKKTIIYETEAKLKSGKIYWAQTTLTPILNENGDVKNLVAIDSDITKLKRAEEKIKTQTLELENSFIELERKNKFISNSIEYAKKIQDAFLPSQQEFKKIFPNSFMFFKPRDIVSGDFYWTTKIVGSKQSAVNSQQPAVNSQQSTVTKPTADCQLPTDDLLIVALIDCTGHGVPGAFMSLIATTLLNEIVCEKKIYKPSQVLTQLNQGIVAALHQNEKQSTQDDGMDIVFCVFNTSDKKLNVSATSKMAIICDKTGLTNIDYNVFSIGGAFSALKNAVYNETEIEINPDSQLFLFSDGYYDQFGGPNNEKYMINKFEKFLTSIYKLPAVQQQKEIENNFINWKGKNKQIDDVLVIGIKFSDIYNFYKKCRKTHSSPFGVNGM